MPVFASLKQKLQFHRLVRLRHRYWLTRGNRVRLRYVAVSVSALVLVSFAIVGVPNPSESSIHTDGHQGVRVMDTALSDVLQNGMSDGMRKAKLALKKAPEPEFQEVQIENGDTIAGALQKAGVGGQEAYLAIKALSEHFDPRSIKPGQRIGVQFAAAQQEGERGPFIKMNVKLDPVKEIFVRKDHEDFVSEMKEKKLVQRSYAKSAEIETSLYGSAARAGIPPQVIAEVIRIYSWDVDFQRDIQPGDIIEVLYDTYETEDGSYKKYGDVLHANLSVNGKAVPIFRYEMKDGRVDYFEPDGHSIRKTLMKTPVDGARLSSGFGMRKHPVLGYNKMHKGADFAAPTGTPIYAAGDGVIEFAARNGSYGNYVRIRHNSTLKTAYAHMHKFRSGIAKGKRVEQGDVIGYIGTTGRSTGPHLHYEVLVNNKQVNPKSVDLPTGEQLEGQEMQRFRGLMAALQQQYVALSEGLKFAQKHDGEDSSSSIR